MFFPTMGQRWYLLAHRVEWGGDYVVPDGSYGAIVGTKGEILAAPPSPYQHPLVQCHLQPWGGGSRYFWWWWGWESWDRGKPGPQKG